MGCGLQHDRAPGGQRRSDLPRDHRQGKIPWRDAGHHADGLLDDDDALVGLVSGNGVAVESLGLLAKPFEEGCRIRDLATRLGQRLALFECHQRGQVLLIHQHQVSPSPENHGPLAGRGAPPGREGMIGRCDGLPRFSSAK